MPDRANSWAQLEILQPSIAGAPVIALDSGLSFQNLPVRLRPGQTPTLAASHPSTMSETRSRGYSLFGFDKLSPNGNGQEFVKGRFTPEPS